MLTSIVPKLPMRDKSLTRVFYLTQLGFEDIGSADYDGYLLVKKDNVEIHFFEFNGLDPKENYGKVYIRTNDNNIHPAGHLQAKPWGQKEFAMLDPDNNLLTFGQCI